MQQRSAYISSDIMPMHVMPWVAKSAAKSRKRTARLCPALKWADHPKVWLPVLNRRGDKTRPDPLEGSEPASGRDSSRV
jgi:hypothetical protein